MSASVLTIVGRDRPGLVELVSRVVAENGGNWESSRLARLGGQFAGIALVTFDDRAPDLQQALDALTEHGLTVRAEPAAETPEAVPSQEAGCRTFSIELVGNDRPGILAEVARVLAASDLNVEELGTSCESAPMSGGELFRLRALVTARADLSLDHLTNQFESLSAELLVEIDVDEIPED